MARSAPRLVAEVLSDERNFEAARVHGRLLEAAHIAGYTFNRAADELDWLLQDDRWKGLGFADGHAFAESIYGLFKEFKSSIAERTSVAQKLAGIASQRDIAKVLGVNVSTVSRDLSVANATDEPKEPNENGTSDKAFVANATPREPWFERDGDEAAKLLSHKARGTQGTGENEWYTPSDWLDRARTVLGRIDLDPASSALAQRIVKAKQFYSVDDDGLTKEWHGRVWMNPPYAQPAIGDFAEKLATEVEAGHVKAAIALTHNYTDTQWFHRLASAADAICFPEGRIRFVAPDGTLASPTQGQALFYFGKAVELFQATFGDAGVVLRVPP